MQSTSANREKEMAKSLCSFVNKCPTPFHVVAESKRLLIDGGFTELSESKAWDLKPNGKYFMTRNGSTLIAFAIGGKWRPGNAFSIVGAHTDSPCLRLKPVSSKAGAGKVHQVGVQAYGGGIWHTWFDRDLTVAGRVITRDGEGASSLSERLVHLEQPTMKVCSLAIHLDRSVNESFSVNKEKHLAPIVCRQIEEAANFSGNCSRDQHNPELLRQVAERINCSPSEIVDWELYISDTQPAQLIGLREEFISSPRLDNQLSCFTGLLALIEAGNLDSDSSCRVLSLYDHEEIGSQSAQGAQSALTANILRKICVSSSGETDTSAMEMAMPQSLLVSADVAHAVNPNYQDKHEVNHAITLFDGVAIKENVNQRYATNMRTKLVLNECLRLNNLQAGLDDRLQEFVVRQDFACGSTIGPIVASNLAIPTIDVGACVLGMHSCRETAAACSVMQCIRLFTAFYANYDQVSRALTYASQ